jgi:hypothetical protein
MGRSAVELHRKSMLAPQGVDPNAANLAVDFGRRNSGLLAEVEEALLEDAEGLRELGKVGVPSRPECTRADAAFPEHGFELHRVEHPAVVGLS